MDEIKLPINLVNAILQYLGTRPYAEVFQLVDGIQKEGAKSQDNPAIEPS